MSIKVSSYPGTLFKVGSSGEDVKKIQTALGLQADGIYNEAIATKVREFQTKNGLQVDGIVGPITWDKLIPPRERLSVITNPTGATGATGSVIQRDFSTIINIPQLNRFQGPTPLASAPRGRTASNALKKTLKAQFDRKAEELGSKIIAQGLDITKYFLPDEEILKHLISESVPSFSPESLNIMAYGTAVNPNLDIAGNFTNIKSQIENAVKNSRDQLRNAANAAAQNVRAQAQAAQTQIGLAVQNAAADARNQLNTNIQTGADASQSLANRLTNDPLQIDISQLYNLPPSRYSFDISETDTEYVAKIKYRKFDQGIIEVGQKKYLKDYKVTIDGKELSGRENLEKVLQDEAEKKGFFGYLKDESQAAVKAQKEEIKKRAEALIGESETVFDNLSQWSNYNPFPLKKDNPLWQKVKNEKELIKNMVHKFMEHQKDVFNAMITSITQTSSAIPAIGIIISTPPFNLPAAISLGTLVLAAINELVSKIPPILDYLQHLQRLSMFVSKRAYEELVRLLNPVLELLIRLMDPLGLLKKFILKLLEAIKKLFSKQSCDKQRRRIRRDIRRKERDIRRENDQEEKLELEDELKDLKERLADVDKKCREGSKPPLEQDIQDLNQVLQEANTLSEEMMAAVEEMFVYDVTLPDGSQILGISEEELNSLRAQYNVIMG